MSGQFGLTADEALAQIMVLVKNPPPETELRSEVRKILWQVRSLAYHDGFEEGRIEFST